MSLLKRIEKGKTEGLESPMEERTVYEVILRFQEKLNLSADFNSPSVDRIKFWEKFERDLGAALDINSIADIKDGRKNLQFLFEKMIQEEKILLSRPERARLFERIANHCFGFGVLDALLEDETISEIFINDFQEIFISRKGRIYPIPVSFWSEQHLFRVIDRICIKNNIELPSRDNPAISTTLSDGSLLTIVSPPVSTKSLSVTIRRFFSNRITIDQLITFGTLSTEMAIFLKTVIESRLNIVICGSFGAGIITLTGILSGFIPGDERVIAVEHANELSLRVKNLVKLKSGRNTRQDEPSFEYLLNLSKNMGGDRLILGNLSNQNAYDILSTINFNFPGSFLLLSGKSPSNAIEVMETLVQLQMPNLSIEKIRDLIVSTIDIIVYQERLSDGTRTVKNIVEVTDEINAKGKIVLREIFSMRHLGLVNGRVTKDFINKNLPSEKIINRLNETERSLLNNVFSINSVENKSGKLSEVERKSIKYSKGKYAFMAYSRQDSTYVYPLAEELEKNGFDIWLDISDVKPGENWSKNLENALKEAGAFIVILSPASINSDFVRGEISMAWDEKIPIIPVLLEECDVPILIRGIQYISFDKDDSQSAASILSETLSRFISNEKILGEI